MSEHDFAVLEKARLPALRSLRIDSNTMAIPRGFSLAGAPALTALEFSEAGAVFVGQGWSALRSLSVLATLRRLHLGARSALSGLDAALQLESLQLRLLDVPPAELRALSSLTLLTELAVTCRVGSYQEYPEQTLLLAHRLTLLRSLSLRTPRDAVQSASASTLPRCRRCSGCGSIAWCPRRSAPIGPTRLTAWPRSGL
jgi:hypothetical protein